MAVGSPKGQTTKKPPLLLDPIPFSLPEPAIRKNGWGAAVAVEDRGFLEQAVSHLTLSPYPTFSSVLSASSPTQEEPTTQGLSPGIMAPNLWIQLNPFKRVGALVAQPSYKVELDIGINRTTQGWSWYLLGLPCLTSIVGRLGIPH